MKLYVTFIVFTTLLSTVTGDIRSLPGLPQAYYSPGNISLGIVVPVHKYDRYSLCSDELRELGSLQRVEAMVYAIDEINNSSKLLPNHRLGFILLDDCSKDTTALARTLHFIQNTSTVSSNQHLQAYDVVGVIGTESSRNSVQMADMLSIFKVPLLSYLSTSPDLSNKDSYPYFSRIVPSDVLQAKVIGDVIKHFNWTYISIIYAEGNYGTKGYQAVKERIEESDSCVAVVREMRQSFSDTDYDNIIIELQKTPRAKVVVVFSPLSQARKLMMAVQRQGAAGKFTWIGSDAWGRNIQDYEGIEEATNGALTIKFYSQTVEKFDNHFKYLTPKNSSNPWIKDFIATEFNCSFTPGTNKPLCSESRNFVPDYRPEITVSLVIDAVYTYAYALDRLITECSTSQEQCLSNGERMVSALRNVTFQGEHGKVAFDDVGDGVAIYEVQNFRYLNGMSSLNSVGHWNSEFRTFTSFHPESIQWNPEILSEGEANPLSTCSDQCPYGFQAVVTQPHCCWYCQTCRSNERTVMRDNLPKCEICPTEGNFTWPDPATKTLCEPIAPTIVSVNDFTGVLIVAFNTITILLAIAVLVLYIINNKERLIKASSRELSYMMLAGIFISSIFAGFFLAVPTDANCIITDLGFHLSFTFSYGPLLVKTNRIYRIFTSGKKSKKRPPFIDSKYQIIFALLTILVQVIIVTVSTIVDQPRALNQMPSFSEQYVEITCKLPEVGFLCSLVFNLLLVILCTFYAVMTRKLPDNFNESKFISFCVYTTIVFWITFIPTYFTTTKTIYRTLFLSLAMLANSLVTILFLFLPKLYALYLVSSDQQHVNAATSTLRTGTLESGNGVMKNLPKPNFLQVTVNSKVSPVV